MYSCMCFNLKSLQSYIHYGKAKKKKRTDKSKAKVSMTSAAIL